MAKIFPNFQANRHFAATTSLAASHAPSLGDKGCFLVPTGGEVFAAGTPPHQWTAPNGVKVIIYREGRVNHFHCPDNMGDLQVPTGWDFATVAIANHRHLGPARHALRAFQKVFVVDSCQQAFLLRQLVRSGD